MGQSNCSSCACQNCKNFCKRKSAGNLQEFLHISQTLSSNSSYKTRSFHSNISDIDKDRDLQNFLDDLEFNVNENKKNFTKYYTKEKKTGNDYLFYAFQKDKEKEFVEMKKIVQKVDQRNREKKENNHDIKTIAKPIRD